MGDDAPTNGEWFRNGEEIQPLTAEETEAVDKGLAKVRDGATARYKFTDNDGTAYFNREFEGDRENEGESILEIAGEPTLRESYKGTFTQNTRAGYGVYTYHNGDTFTGEWENGLKASIAYDGDGNVTSQTLGKLVYAAAPAGDEGEAKPEERSRPGQYFGNYAIVFGKSMREGTGTFTYSNGDMYCGEWKHGLKDGQGTYSYKADGTRMEGTWKEGEIVSGKWVFPNGIYFIGRFKNGKPNGEGNWVFNDGVRGATQITGTYSQSQIGEVAEPEEGQAPPPIQVKVDWTSKEIVVA